MLQARRGRVSRGRGGQRHHRSAKSARKSGWPRMVRFSRSPWLPFFPRGLSFVTAPVLFISCPPLAPFPRPRPAAEEVDACIASVSMHLSFTEGDDEGEDARAARGDGRGPAEGRASESSAAREKARQTAERQALGLRRCELKWLLGRRRKSSLLSSSLLSARPYLQCSPVAAGPTPAGPCPTNLEQRRTPKSCCCCGRPRCGWQMRPRLNGLRCQPRFHLVPSQHLPLQDKGMTPDELETALTSGEFKDCDDEVRRLVLFDKSGIGA